MIKKCLIANRGEIAVRILSTCKKMGIQTVVAYSLVDKESMAVTMADESVCIGPNQASLSYMNIDHLCEAALLTHCDAIHPGYGFLSESYEFAKKVEACGLIFIGPSSTVLKKISNKSYLKKLVKSISIPVIEGDYDIIDDIEDACLQATSIGYPVMLKPSSGGGGRGIRIISDSNQLRKDINLLKAQGFHSLYLEKYITESRHIEVQLIADKHQNIVHLSSRNCTLQVHYQKFLEEAPFFSIDPILHRKIIHNAVSIVHHLAYDHIATIEFLIDKENQVFFMEINPRIQVEHPLSEMISKVDIVEQQILSASGAFMTLNQDDISFSGYAIECRVNAQDGRKSFQPSTGIITKVHWPKMDHVRMDTALFEGSLVSAHYDSLLAKVIVWGETREQALLYMIQAIDQISIEGVTTNLDFLRFVLKHDGFERGNYTSDLFDHAFDQWLFHNSTTDPLICPQCLLSLSDKQRFDHLNVCESCGHHFRLSASKRVQLLMDEETFVEIDAQARSDEDHDFPGYAAKLKAARVATGMNEAVICGFGKLNGLSVCIGVLDASFMMGSMGHVVGDKITRLIEMAKDMCLPLIIVSASGGARMQEGIVSLMQMAKTAAALQRFDASGGLFISVFTDPTTGGVSASFAMLGDILISEPQALIGFAGKRVIEKTIKETLPEEFQRAETLLEHGFLDMIVDRRNLKQVLGDCVKLHPRQPHE